MARKAKPATPSSNDQPRTRNNAASSGPPGEEEYKVGPGHPPKEHQWKPGQSGNPKGAKRKQPSILPDLKEVLGRAFNRKVKMTDGERRMLLTRWETGVEQLSVQFALGDRYARRDTLWIMEKFGPEFLTPKTAPDEPLAENRQAILDGIVRVNWLEPSGEVF